MGYVSGDISDISGVPCYTVYYCILLIGDYYGGEYFVLPRTASAPRVLVNKSAVRTLQDAERASRFWRATGRHL